MHADMRSIPRASLNCRPTQASLCPTIRTHVCASFRSLPSPGLCKKTVKPSRSPLLLSALKKQQTQKEKKEWSFPSLFKPKKQEEKPELPKPKWGLLNWTAYNQAWEVPWGRKELALGIVGWAVSFVAVGLLLVPLLGAAGGVKDFSKLTSTDKSLIALLNQVLETIVGIGVIKLAVSKVGPIPDEVFKLDFRKPFSKPEGWLVWAILGTLAAPVIVGATASIISATGYEDLVTDKRGTVDGVAQILSLDWRTFASLFSVTAILAPILEETVFRGFLLTTLTKYMPTWAAVLISSAGFGAAHASAKDFPQLAALGTLLGFSYVRSRNLLTPIVIHGAWNGTVLVALFTLVSSGVDLQEVLKAASGSTAVDFLQTYSSPLHHLIRF